MCIRDRVKAVGEIVLRISHNLIANPGTKIEDVREVYSHPQALGQCRRYLRDKKWKLIPVYDTAGAVWMIKGRKRAAAIASRRSAEIYGMDILEEGIEDYRENYTRFLVLGNQDLPIKVGRKPYKTTILFGLKHVPGSLYRALGEFALRGINLTKIESRPTKNTPWEYYFFVDFEGRTGDENVDRALAGLRSKATFIKDLGSYLSGIVVG